MAEIGYHRGNDLTVSVIIPVYRDWHQLGLCLEALAKQTLPAGEIEIIVVNNEPDGDCAPTALPPNARIVNEPRPGSYSARNTGVGLARGAYLAFTDADCLPDPNWLASGVRLLRERPDARVTGPVPLFREPNSSYYAFLFEFHTGFRQKESAARGVCITANLLVPKAVFEAVGPFDDRMFSGGDFEWNRRAREQGVPLIYDEAVRVLHPARRSLRSILKKKRRTGGPGLWAKKISNRGLIWRALKPPLGAMAAFDRAPIRRRDHLPLMGVLWLTRIVENSEIVMVRLGLKKPNRS